MQSLPEIVQQTLEINFETFINTILDENKFAIYKKKIKELEEIKRLEYEKIVRERELKRLQEEEERRHEEERVRIKILEDQNSRGEDSRMKSEEDIEQQSQDISEIKREKSIDDEMAGSNSSKIVYWNILWFLKDLKKENYRLNFTVVI